MLHRHGALLLASITTLGFLMVGCATESTDAQIQELFDQIPPPSNNWTSIASTSECTDDSSSTMPPYLVASGDGGSGDYLDATAAILDDAGFAVQRTSRRTDMEELTAVRGEGRALLQVQVFSGIGQNPEGDPLPASTTLRIVRGVAWCG